MTTWHEKLSEKIWIALFIAVPFAFHSKVYEGAFLPKLLVFQIALLALICLAAHQSKQVKCNTPYLTAVGIYALVNTLSICQAINPIEALFHLSHHIGLILLPLIILNTLSVAQLGRIIAIAPWAGLPIAGIGMAQYFGWGFDAIPSNAQPSATFFHRNAAAAYIICILPLAWVGLQLAQAQARVFAQSGLILILGIFLVFTRTRAAWVGLAGATIIVFIVAKSTSNPIETSLQMPKRRLLGITAVLICLSAFIPEGIQGDRRVQFDEKKENAITALSTILTNQGHRGRLELWQHTLSMIRQHPLGVGLGNWQFQYPFFARGSHLNVKAAPERPHNDPLWIASELGLVGLFAFVTILFCSFSMAKTLCLHPSLHIRTTTYGLLTLMLAYLIDGNFSFPRGQMAPSIIFWFALGSLAVLYAHQTNTTHTRFSPVWLLSIPLVLLCITITVKRIQYDIHHQKVHTAERKADWPTVLQEAAMASQIGTYRANTFIAQGRAYYHTGNMSAAQKAYETGLRLHPNSLNACNNLGIVHRRLGHNAQAEQAFQKALYLYPQFVEASYNLGNLYRDMKRWDDAITAYQNAQNHGLHTPHLYFNLGLVYAAKGDPAKAQNFFIEALNCDPDFGPAANALQKMNKK